MFLIASTVLADLNDGLLAYYPFDGNADDKSGNGYNGTVYGALLGVDRFGNSSGAYSFDGVDDYISLGKVSLNVSGSFSISVWVKTPETKTYKVIFSKSSKKSSGHYELYIGDTHYSNIEGEVRFYAPNLDDEGTDDIKGEFGSTKSIDNDIYHHVLMTYDGNYITFFIDSNQISQETADGNITEETELFYIGAHPLDSPQMFFEGLIDDLRIYNRVLDESEIKELYDSHQESFIDGLIAHYPFNGNANDESGNNNHGTVNGATLVEDRFGNENSAYAFDGVDDRIQLDESAINGLDSFSIGFWLKTSDSGSVKHFISGANSTLHNEFVIRHDAGSVILYVNGKSYAMGSAKINDNLWHSIVITRASSEVKLYIDSQFDFVWESAPTGELTVETSGLWLGGDQDCVGGCWQTSQQYAGIMDDLSVYNRVLSESEINELYGVPTDVAEIQDFENGAGLWMFETNGDVPYNISSEYSKSGNYSLKAGPSSCGSSCHDRYAVSVIRQFDVPTYISSIAAWVYEEGNWGGYGYLKIDDEQIGTPTLSNRNNYESEQPGWVEKKWEINKNVSVVTFYFSDMTSQNPMYIDDIVIDVVPTYVTEIQYADIILDAYYSGVNPDFDSFYGDTNQDSSGDPIEISPDIVLGNNEGFLSLPTGSYVVVGFTDNTIVDAYNQDDIYIDEVGSMGELADVYVSSDNENFVFLGKAGAGGVTSLDLADIQFTEPVTAIKIVGLDNKGASPGFDLISVRALEGAVGPAPPVEADFSASDTIVTSSQSVKFTDLSTGNPSSWKWDFDTDGVIDSTERHPSWTYANEGTYSVRLEVGNGASSDEENKPDYITVMDKIIADSELDFSGVQGQNNWFYGYYAEPFQSSKFTLMEQFSSGTWLTNEGIYWTRLYSSGGCPNGLITSQGRTPVEHWCVRRWKSEITGEVTISGVMAKTNTSGGDGATGYIFVDGETAWTRSIDYDDNVGVNYSVNVFVTEGSIIDFAISPNNSDLYDWVRFTAKIEELTAHAEEFGDVEFPQGEKSFADAVVGFTPGTYGVDNPYSNTSKSLGVPDFQGGNATIPDTAVSLGNGGTLVLQFNDNSLTTSGDNDFDLWIFEVGSLVEKMSVYISKEGTNWIDVGIIEGATSGVDIDAHIGNGVVLGEKYSYVKLIDDKDDNVQTDASAGADIDAVGAISSAPPVATTTLTFKWPGNDQWDVFQGEQHVTTSAGAASLSLPAGTYTIKGHWAPIFEPFDVTIENGAEKVVKLDTGSIEFRWPGDDQWDIFRGDEFVTYHGGAAGRHLEVGTYTIIPRHDPVFEPFEVVVEKDAKKIIEILDDGTASISTIFNMNLSAVEIKSPPSATPDSQVDISWRINNTGVENAQGEWTDRVYLSYDETIDANDALLYEESIAADLEPDAGYWRTSTVNIPDDIEQGSYFFIVATDDDNAMNEAREEDNIVIQPVTIARPKFMTAHPGRVSVNVTPGIPATGQIELGNIGDFPVSGITATVENAAVNLAIQANPPSALESWTSDSFTYTITASDDSIQQNQAELVFESAQGWGASVMFDITVLPAMPRLATTPGYLECGMLRGSQRMFEFELANTGGAPARDLTLLTPESSWLKLVTPAGVGTLGPGETRKVQLLLSPPADMALGPYSGDMVVSGTNANLRVGFRFMAVSDAKGALKVTATDEFTYFAEDHPNVAGAEVIVKNAFSGEAVAEGLTDDSGEFLVPNINEGRYSLEVRAEKHGTHHSVIEITPGDTKEVEAFLQRQLVTYRWTVEPTEIEDNYTVTLEAEFETHVPAPVVTVEPSFNFVPLFQDETTIINLTITNHGLIAAQGVTLRPFESGGVYAEPEIENIGTLPPMTSVTIPVKVSAKPDARSNRQTEEEPDAICLSGCVEWYYYCGEKRTNHACIMLKAIKDFMKKIDKALSYLDPINGVLSFVEKTLPSFGADEEVVREITDIIREIKSLGENALKCATIAAQNWGAIIDCASAICNMFELHNKLVDFADKRLNWDIGDTIDESRCICAAISVISSVSSFRTLPNAADKAEEVAECLCNLKLNPTISTVGVAGSGSGNWSGRLSGISGPPIIINPIQCPPCGSCNFSSDKYAPERCFGGVGNRCEGVLGAPMTKDKDNCKVHGYMSVGSILHDRCCIEHRNGVMCGGDGTEKCTDSDGNEINCCQEEWDEAFANTGCSTAMNSPRQWEYTWGPYRWCENPSDDTNAPLYAPSGTRVNPKYGEFCEFGCKDDGNGNIIIESDLCGDYCVCR